MGDVFEHTRCPGLNLVKRLLSANRQHDRDRYKTDLAQVLSGHGTLSVGSSVAYAEMVSGVGWHEISIDNLTLGMARSTDGQLWRMYLTYDEAKHTLKMTSRRGSGAVTYAWETPDRNHLVLHTGGTALTFDKVPTPAQYPWLTRGFHLVSEWGYER